MPGGAKKAVFPTLALHDHDSGGLNAQDQERQRRRFRGSLRKAESKDSPEKDKADVPPRPKQTGNGSPRTEVGAK